jgi:uncharacterized protein (TIGR03083 family)
MIVGMDHDRLLGSLRRDAAALLEAARAAGADAPVPACPGWTAGELVWHIGEVHEFWGTIVADRLDTPDGYVQSPRPATFDETVTFAESTAAALLDALESTDPATPVWTWASDSTAGFVLRRMAHETAVHRLDAERAAGRDHVIDADLASDGVDEFLSEFLVWVADGAPPLAGSVHVHCTDVAGEWLVRDDGAGGHLVTREHAKGDAAIRGPAADLLLVLWRRLPLDAVEVIGDRAAAERLVARTNLSG